jgi:small subunit ribosomal protein S20
MRQNQRRNLQNRSVKARLKTLTKRLRSSAAAEGTALLRECHSALDKAASQGVIHKNTANRKKARLARALARAAKAPAAPAATPPAKE